MATAEAATTKNQLVHSPLLRFRMRAHCKNCELYNACRIDRQLERNCILALQADSQHFNTQLNKTRGASY